jgi:hypothetical protein
MNHAIGTLFLLALLLGLTNPGLAGTLRCTTYEEKTLNRLQTVCEDGTRAISTYNRVLERWETLVTESPRPSCTTRMHPQTKDVEVRCR